MSDGVPLFNLILLYDIIKSDWEALPWVPCSAAMDGPAFYSVALNLSCADGG